MKKPERSLAEFREAFQEYLLSQEKKNNHELEKELEDKMEEKRNKLLRGIVEDASDRYILVDLVEFLSAREEYSQIFET